MYKISMEIFLNSRKKIKKTTKEQCECYIKVSERWCGGNEMTVRRFAVITERGGAATAKETCAYYYHN